MFLQLVQRNADYRPEETAIRYGDRSITHAEYADRVERYARGLIRHGVSPGDRVALLLDNSPDFLMSFFAVAACRGINVPLNLEYKEDELRFYVSDARVRFIVVDEQRLELATRVASGIDHPVSIIVSGSGDCGALTISEVATAGEGVALPSPSLDDHIIFIYSSGSTGRPKCAPRTVVQYWWETQSVVEHLHLGRNDTIFCSIPLFHNFGAVHCMLASVACGAKLVLFEKPRPFALRRAEVLRALEREKATIFPCVPFMLDHLANSSAPADLSSIRICYSAAAALAQETADAFHERFNLAIRNHYGCTEVGVMTINLDEDPREHGQSVGTPFPGVHLRIADDDGRDVPIGETGELLVRTRAMTSGYAGMDELNAQAFRDGYFHTGDLGRLDSEGRLYLSGRKKFVIDAVGQKVSPFEVEDVLKGHASVKDVVVIGVRNGSGEAVQAYVVRERTCSADELISFCRKKLANCKVPQRIAFISQVPRSSIGKILRNQEAIDRHLLDDSDMSEAI